MRRVPTRRTRACETGSAPLSPLPKQAVNQTSVCFLSSRSMQTEITVGQFADKQFVHHDSVIDQRRQHPSSGRLRCTCE